jgi:hypothetical protein
MSEITIALALDSVISLAKLVAPLFLALLSMIVGIFCHVWTAPGWQSFLHVCSVGRCSHDIDDRSAYRAGSGL